MQGGRLNLKIHPAAGFLTCAFYTLSLACVVLDPRRLSISEVDRFLGDFSDTCSTVLIGSVVLVLQLAEYNTIGAVVVGGTNVIRQS